MDAILQDLWNRIKDHERLDESEKELYLRALTEFNKNQNSFQFERERIEKEKMTLSVMLQESIDELQKKTKAIEEVNTALQNKNHELEIESSLERVRFTAMGMKDRADMLEICRAISVQLELLGVKDIRNVQTAIIHESKSTYTNYEFYAKHNKSLVTEVSYKGHFVQSSFAEQMLKGPNEVFTFSFNGEQVAEWYEYQKTTNVFIDNYIEKANSLNYYWYSLGPVAMGISTYSALTQEETNLFIRFRNVFELAYRRYLDIERAETHARQAAEDLIKLQSEKKRAEDALTELKATQTQLVQSEKMASLGELTAGIAHEIQNPLNFVNNFSEVSTELISEMLQEVSRGHSEEARIIAEDIKQNLEKILHHGRRADAIVKGMLQHSRTSSGQKEPTDINMLCDEYLRLAYHGLRAKEKSFNALFETDFDPNIGKINIVPQDIGRVLLNLINNAFYAVNQKQKIAATKYEPTVKIITKLLKTSSGTRGSQISITVRDNGDGIPQKILDKIFQPFFTTKPTGEGTGLGLSLSYDIVRAHGGDIKVETKEGSYTNMIIYLPGAS